MIVENTSFTLFRLCVSFRNNHLVEGYRSLSKLIQACEKIVLRADTFFGTMRLFRKSPKTGFLVSFLLGKSDFRVSGVFIELFFGNEKRGKILKLEQGRRLGPVILKFSSYVGKSKNVVF